ncbi:MAG: hypothetical protein HY049_15525 [Acidobacteria bacterium]|nr:hypothetical protein [Acidobacteriota bacterium]
MTPFLRRAVTWGVGAAVAIGGVSFVYKLYEFIVAANRGNLPGFAYATVVSYFIVTLGFLCMVLWAFLRGHYTDIEEPKHRLLENERALDREGSPAPPIPEVRR